MRILLIVLFTLIGLVGLSQDTITSTILKDSISSGKVVEFMQLKAGSCGSPDGPMNSTVTPPPSYAWLQTNGYCNPNAYGFSPTTCWTFVPTSSSVTINSGFAHNCANVAFANFTLYDNTCSVIGTGLSFTGLVPGQTYTWCFDGNSWNTAFDDFFSGPCTGFIDFCPYFTNNIVLPIELYDFFGYSEGEYNYLEWTTMSEINNDYFLIERSEDGIVWEELGRVDGAGNSSQELSYVYIDKDPFISYTYYSLTQVDYDGKRETFDIISVQNESDIFYVYFKAGDDNIYLSRPEYYELYNMMGQAVAVGSGDEINTDSFDQGIYILRIGSYTQRLFIR